MMQSQKLPRLTCLTFFTCTSHPVHCVPRLTPALFGFQKNKKDKFQVQITWNKLQYSVRYAATNPSSKFNSKPHYSSQPMDQTPKFHCFRCQPYPNPPTSPPFRVDLPVSMRACCTCACLRVCVCRERACVRACVRVCVCVCVL